MKDYIEIIDFCGYDLAKSHEMARASGRKKVIWEGLEDVAAIQSESGGAQDRGLHRAGDLRRDGLELDTRT